MVSEESILSFARPKWRLQKAVVEKLQRCARASSRRGRRSTPPQPAQSLAYSGLVGCSLSCARARTRHAVRSGRRQRRRVGRVLGHRAGHGDRIDSVWTRARAVPRCAVPCASRPSHGTLARVRQCARVRSMWTALGEGEPSHGVTLGWEPARCPPRAVGPISARVCDPESGTHGDRPTVGRCGTVV